MLFITPRTEQIGTPKIQTANAWRAAARLAFACMLLVFTVGCSAIGGNNPNGRSLGTIIDDGTIERVAKRKLRRASPELKRAHLVTVSYNGVLLVLGQVATAEAKAQAAQVVSELREVRRVENALEVSGRTTFLARTNDSWITSKVKTKLLANKNVRARHIKVVTENGAVYLMGLLAREEAEAAVDIASSVFGVEKIVKVFEYLDSEPSYAIAEN